LFPVLGPLDAQPLTLIKTTLEPQTMPNSLMYQDETHFVLLEADQPEQLLTSAELLAKLKAILSDRQDDLPRDLQKFSTIDAQATYLLETSCEFDLGPGKYFQWYVVRLEK
jgi:hypothetical protein